MAGRTARYQGGSIVSFIIIAVIVTAALGIGLYVLRQRSEQSRISSTTSQDVPAELPGAPDDEADEGAPADDTDTDTETLPAYSQDETAQESADDQGTATGTTATGGTTPTSEPTGSSPTVTTLPETGSEQLLIVPVLGAVVYMAAAYAGSSRALSRLR